MYIPKRYGESKINRCPFCGKDAYAQNKQKIPTCKDHKETLLQDIKCVCGSWLEMREGKFGVFFTCINCGALNMRKVLEMRAVNELSKKTVNTSVKIKQSEQKKEMTISSEELDFI